MSISFSLQIGKIWYNVYVRQIKTTPIALHLPPPRTEQRYIASKAAAVPVPLREQNKTETEKGAMLNKILSYFEPEPEDKHDYIFQIPLDKVYPNPNQPRKYFDKTALFELAESIREYGVIQPITVRESEDGYELIAGERRWRGAYMAGLETIPCIIVEASDRKSALLSLLENLQREDLSFFEVAESYKNLIKDQGMTQEELAYKVGKSQSSVANKLRLLKLPPRVKKIIRDYGLSERHARALLQLPGEEAQTAAALKICESRLNVAQSEELIKAMLRDKTYVPIKKRETDNVKIFDNTIKKVMNTAKKQGLTAECTEEEHDWGVEYRIALMYK